MQVKTPDAFIEEIEQIQNRPLSLYISFSGYISHLFSKLECGVPYVARNTKMQFIGNRTWKYECIFGGRSRNSSNKSKKDYNCNSYIEFTATRNDKGFTIINFKQANWNHNHPLDKLFLEANGIISDKRIDEIKEMALKGYKAKDIRKKSFAKNIISRKFYDIRRAVKRNLQKNEIADLLKNCENYLNYFNIIHHWKIDTLTKIKKYNGSAFIAKRFSNLPIALDVVFMDDTTCVDQYDFPLITICFEDYNKARQILAFSFIPGREKVHFKSFLQDVKNHIQRSIRVFIIDRWKSQVCAIAEVFPDSNIVFCRIHIFRNIRSVFGDNSKVGSLFNQLIQRTISEETYIEELKKLIKSAKKHKRFLQNLLEEIHSYSPFTIDYLMLRGHRTTNIQEGLFGTLKQHTNNDIVPLSELFEIMKDIFVSGVVKSMSEKPEIFPKKVSRLENIGTVAYEILDVEQKEANSRINSAMTHNLNQIQTAEILNEKCTCSIKHEYGLPCRHDILNNIKNCIKPYIPDNSIPSIYLIPSNAEEAETNAESLHVDDNPEAEIDFSYSNIMPKLSKIATHAKKNKDIQKNLIELFENIQSIELGKDYEPLTIHEKGRKMGRPSNCGARRKKRVHHCSICGSSKHNKATCHFKKYDTNDNEKNNQNNNQNNREEEEEEEANDDDILIENEYNYSDDETEEYDEDDEAKVNINDNDNEEESENMELDESENMELDDSENYYINEGNIIKKHSQIIKSLSPNQLMIINQCPKFEKFLWQIAEHKNSSDRATINGVYYTQYSAIKNYVRLYMNENESPEIEAIKLIFEVNFDKNIPKELISDILEMCKEWDTSLSIDLSNNDF